MKVTKTQLEAMVLEAVQAEVKTLNEEELAELLGGLKGMFQAGAKGVASGAQKAAGAVAGAANQAAGAVKGAAQQVGGAVKGAAQQAAGAVKGAYQQGETQAAVQNVSKGIQNMIATVDKAIQTTGKTDPNLAHTLDNVKGGLQSAASALTEGTKPKEKKWVRKSEKK